jgi:fermentation-respiration switch protein FrsA (DUF1100 family)
VGIRTVTISALVFTLVLLLAAIWFGQRSLMYFPDSAVGSPADAELRTAEPVQFQTEDGLDLGGWYVPPGIPTSGYTVIVFNGNAGHRGYRAPLATGLASLGAGVLLFDYRGYGGNPGLPSEDGLARDARGALAYLRRRPDVDPRRIVYFGESLGTGVAVRLAVEHPPAALILRSPFTSFVSVANHHYPFLPGRWLLRDRYASVDLINQVTSPLLVIAGDEDRIVPFDDSRALFDAAPQPKSFVTIAGADHNDDVLCHGPQVITAAAQLLGLSSRYPQ